MGKITELTRQIESIKRKRKAYKEEYEEVITALDNKLEEAQLKLALANKGIDPDRVERAEQVVSVRGSVSKTVHGTRRDQVRSNVRLGAVEDAISDLALSRGEPLVEKRRAVKNYDGFGDQRCDIRYGYTPRHGYIVFSVGLTNEARKRPEKLTDEEIEDALWYLYNLADIQGVAGEVKGQ